MVQRRIYLLTWKIWLNINRLSTSILVTYIITQMYNPSSLLFSKSYNPYIIHTLLLTLSCFYSIGKLWGSCLCECNSYFTLMTSACAANFSSSWGPDVGWKDQTLAIPPILSHCWASQEGLVVTEIPTYLFSPAENHYPATTVGMALRCSVLLFVHLSTAMETYKGIL